MKKIISFILAAIMVLSCSAMAFATEDMERAVVTRRTDKVYYTTTVGNNTYGYCVIDIFFDSNENNRAFDCNFVGYPNNSRFRITGSADLSSDGKTITVTSACVDTQGVYTTIYRNFTVIINSRTDIKFQGV